ncbi:MAG: hypothetical protein MUF77_01260 [Leptospira sp.]|jgi:hypothetical protein|nr:hypothetical protein [Leptospira sp.]
MDSTKEGKDMDVRLNRLLNSAEKLIQDRKDSKDVSSSKSQNEVNQTETKSDFVVSLPVQYHNIQTRLTELQKLLSKEQARLGVLEDPNSSNENLKELLFENEPLFPELSSSQEDKSRILETSKSTISSLLDELRKKEVESENIFSLGSRLSPREFSGNIGTMSSQSMKPLTEDVVKRLLGG